MCRGAPTVGLMDRRAEIRDFLVSRRARIAPEEVGLPTSGSQRRTPGLRREELAMLARISPDYYTRIERGSATNVSERVLSAVSAALRLSAVEHEHLVNLTRRPDTGPRGAWRAPRGQQVRPVVQWLLDSLRVPAVVQNGRLDLLAANDLGRALFSPVFDNVAAPVNFMFLDPRAPAFYVDWDRMAEDTVAVLRAEAGRNPFDKALSGLVGDLSTRSGEFRVRYAAHNVHQHRTGIKRLRHPVVGELELPFVPLTMLADSELLMFTYPAEPGSASDERLQLLASWTTAPSPAVLGEPTDTPSP
jgi:transcriptional regulator with XRE-family HTH domain